VALQRWTDIVFELSADPAELHELLNIFSRSASDYVDNHASPTSPGN